jgi:hypothetical protein
LAEQELSIPSSSYVSLDEKSLRGNGEKTNEIPSSKKLIGAVKIKDDVISAAAMPERDSTKNCQRQRLYSCP